MTDYCPFCVAGSLIAAHLPAARVALGVLTLAWAVGIPLTGPYIVGRDNFRLQPSFWVCLAILLLSQVGGPTAVGVALVLGLVLDGIILHAVVREVAMRRRFRADRVLRRRKREVVE